MKQVMIFEGAADEELQESINNWLEEQQKDRDIEIDYIKQCPSGPYNICISIFYEKCEDEPS